MTTLHERATDAAAARVHDAVKTYGEGGAAVHALDGITAAFAKGAFTSIMGPSGSGKSTLLHCLAGLDELTDGEVHIGDINLSSLNDRELTMLRRERVGFVFQAFNLIPTLSAEENILLPLSIAGRKPERDWFDTVITTIGIGDRLTHRPSELSGGQQQRVAAARAMMSRPDIIFADEPSGNLDSTSGSELLSFMRRAVAEMGQTIIMVTHDPVAASFSDRIVFLADGKAVDDMVEPTPDSVLDRMKKLGELITMLKAAIKGVFAHKVRLAMTALAIILGVAFVSGTYVFTDTIQARFDTLLDDALAGVDVVVQPVEADFGNETLTLDAGLVDTVSAVPGVAVAQGSTEGYAQPISKDGEAIGGQGPPNLGFNWTPDDGLNPLSIAEGNGRAPQGPGEVVIDAAVAKDFDFAIGDTITIQFETIAPEEFEVVGIANFGDEDNLAGATLAVFETSEAQRVMNLENVFTSIEIRAEAGVEPEVLASAIQETLPADALAQTGAEETNDQLAEVEEGLGFLNTALLTFAGIAIFVGAFIIQNTFRIIVAQRTRELALMRAIGATGSQVVWMVLIEALIVAVIASAIGVGLGVLLAIGLRAGFEALGFIGIPEGALTIAPRTIIVGMTVGIVVTVLSAILPARRASIVPPVAAMRDVDLSAKGKTLRNRAIIGAIVGGIGLALLVFGLFGGPDNAIAFVGAGALFMFLGVATLAPLAAKPVAGVIGWPLPRLFGVSGNLAQENTQRQPRRTASTASALMIGVALVAFVSIFASSTKASVEENILGSFPADLSASSTNFETGVPPAFVADLKALPALTSVTAIQTGPVRIDGVQTALIAADPSTINDVFSIDAAPGALEALDASSILLRTGELEDRGLTVGDTIDVEFALTGVQPLRIAGTYEDDGFGSWFISDEAYSANFGSSFAFRVFANAAEGVDDTTARAAMDGLAETYPTIQIQNKSEVVGAAEDQIDQILALFWLLLGLAVLIAVFGITNTLALSVHERTREIGLLRAVGMSRTGIRRMIRWEAVIIALFGALLGLGLGVVFGWSVIQALSDEGLGTFNLPYLQMMLYLGLAAIAGVIAAIFPARNAAKLNVLEAIAYE